MAANNIALMPLQREGGVDSYLSALAQGQQLKQQRDAGTRAQAQEQRAQTDFDMQRKLQAVDQLGAALDGIQDGDAQGFERVKAFAVQNGLIDPNEAQRYTVEQLPQIRALSQRARTIAKERQQAEMQGKEFDLKRRATEADINQSYAAARASNALASQRHQGPGAGVPLPSRMQAAEDEDIGAIQTTQSINAQLDAISGQIDSGELDLGPVNNLLARGQNYLGASSEGSINFATMMSTLEKMRNDSLLLNKGVQTEGDAVRAWNALIANVNDPRVVKAQIKRIKTLNDQAADQKLRLINVRRVRNNSAPFDPSQIAPSAQQGAAPPAQEPQPPAQAADMPRPRSPQERDALPPGTRYMAPDGTIKVKR